MNPNSSDFFNQDIDHISSERNETEREGLFLRLLAKNYRNIFAAALAIVGNKHDAGDVVQDVCVVAWQKFETLDSLANFRKWACGIAFNIAKAHVRKKRRFRGPGLNETAITRIIQTRSAAMELLELRREVLHDCLQKLSIEDRMYLSKFYQSNMSIREQSKREDTTETSVYSKLKRLRKILSDCVQRTLSQGDRT
ncbi:sigma-70 family RNA polymerase sigma factor [Planctomicrobium sp. SH668]|uniref:sigma-70 family RNA polymerase sigma factor n=1 Tax=Planctomicrobium sp. SH668 TaxID=3448126 RepID=UPI003F5C265B